LTMADAKNGIEMVKSQFVSEGINGQTYWFPGSKPPGKAKSPTAYLLPNYDEYFIGFKDRSAIGEVAKQAGIKGGDSSLLAHIVILDGQIVGGWRRTIQKDVVIIELKLFAELAKTGQQAIAIAAEKYGRFLGLSVEIV